FLKMRKLPCLIVLMLVFLSCKEEVNSDKNVEINQSDFKLKNDFAQLSSKLTNFDTVNISVDLSICTWERIEKIQLTKSNDSLKINLIVEDSDFEVQHQFFKIEENDSVWKIGNFLKNNENRLKTNDSDSSPRMVVFNKTDTLKYYTDGLVDSNNFIAEYYRMMHKIDPTNELYDLITTVDSIK
ncbi:hypothetical protein RM553_19240, partial [Zunongwangia sp. F363]